jgi:hypothetical protein
MSIILEALKKAEQKFQEGSWNVTAGEGTGPWKKAWETIAGRATQQKRMPDVPADAKEQGSPSLLKPRRIAAATLVLLLLVAGAIATHVWLRKAAVTTGLNKPTQTHRANSEASHDALQAPRWSGLVTLRGAIAHGLDIEMKLVREGSKLSGSYYYERIGKDIPVQGTIQETGSIVLEEFVKGQKTGTFTGKFVSGARIEGKWSKPDSMRSRDFFLVSTGLLKSMPVPHDQGRVGQQ